MAFAEISTVQVSPEAIKNYEQIVDIRTPAEWMETGVIKGAKTITFNATDKEGFLNELKANVDLKKPVALICRSGRRSAAAAAPGRGTSAGSAGCQIEDVSSNQQGSTGAG